MAVLVTPKSAALVDLVPTLQNPKDLFGLLAAPSARVVAA